MTICTVIKEYSIHYNSYILSSFQGYDFLGCHYRIHHNLLSQFLLAKLIQKVHRNSSKNVKIQS